MNEKISENIKLNNTKFLSILAIKISLSVLIISLMFIYAKYYLADIFYAQSQLALANGEIIKAQLYVNKAVELNSKEPTYYYGRARIGVIGLLWDSEVPVIERKNQILTDIQKSLDLNQNNLVSKRNVISIYYLLALENVGESQKSIFDEKYLNLAHEYYLDIINEYPQDAGVLVESTVFLNKLGLTSDYQNSIEKIRLLRPDLLEWYPELVDK